MPPTAVHFNGSVNLPDAGTVMHEVATRIPVGLRRITDGETGERNDWIAFQLAKIRKMPELGTAVDTPVSDAAAGSVLPAEKPISWPDLGYANAYLESHGIFDQLRRRGDISEGIRFQVQYPTPLAPTYRLHSLGKGMAITRSYEAALFADLNRLLEKVPDRDLAVQWDVAIEIPYLEVKNRQKDHDGQSSSDGAVFDDYFERTVREISALNPTLDELAADVARCLDQVPTDVPTGLHLCYGDVDHHMALQPESLSVQVDFSNAVASMAKRPVSWVAFTVPEDRSDHKFFEPLRRLSLSSDTELFFGIVPYHPSEETQSSVAKQIALIDQLLALSPTGPQDWGICTGCGLGRVDDADEIVRLLDLHREILDEHVGC